MENFFKISIKTLEKFLKISRVGERELIFDPIRKKNLVCTPEEKMRQLLLLHLLMEKNYPAGRIRVEKGVKLAGMTKRADILVHNKNGQPWLLVECKSPKTELDQSVFDQTMRYNLTLRVPFLAISNGEKNYCCAINYEKNEFEFLHNFPELI